MKRKDILTEVKAHCIQEYSKITHWVHDVEHVKTVVKNGRTLCGMEEVRSKTAFLVELACWLHDLGRVEEESGLEFLRSNHAEISYQLSKKILKPYERVVGRESVFKVLMAVREHNLPQLRHPENRVAQLLQDADRGAGLRIAGVFSMLGYLGIIETQESGDPPTPKLRRASRSQELEGETQEHESTRTQEQNTRKSGDRSQNPGGITNYKLQITNKNTLSKKSNDSQFAICNLQSSIHFPPIYTNAEARSWLPQLTLYLQESGKVELAIQKIAYFKDWYYGSASQAGKGVVVAPLHTDSARILYKKGIGEIETYIEDLRLKIEN